MLANDPERAAKLKKIRDDAELMGNYVNILLCKIGVPLAIVFAWIGLLVFAQILWSESLLTCTDDFI